MKSNSTPSHLSPCGTRPAFTPGRDTPRLCVLGLAGALWTFCALGVADQAPPAEEWLKQEAVFPRFADPARVVTNHFLSLHAEFLAGRLKIHWQPTPLQTNQTVIVHGSADAPGHWLARDWRPYPMASRETLWETTVPVDHPDIPIVYFLQVAAPDHPAPRFSPMRICYPRRLGVEEPTRVFWPFLEGFEEDLESWQIVSSGARTLPLSLSPTARNGRAALQVAIPTGQRSTTVATTRVRGWQVRQHEATGLSVWLRALDGVGRARFTLLAQAFTTNQVVAASTWQAPLSNTWQRIDLPFDDFPGITLNALDLFTIEFVANGPSQFLVDDLQLLGWWPLQ